MFKHLELKKERDNKREKKYGWTNKIRKMKNEKRLQNLLFYEVLSGLTKKNN